MAEVLILESFVSDMLVRASAGVGCAGEVYIWSGPKTACHAGDHGPGPGV